MRLIGLVAILAGGCDLIFTVPDRATPDGSPVGMCAFGAPRQLGLTTTGLFDPALRGDELELFYVQQVAAQNNSFDLFRSTRATKDDGFVDSSRVDALDTPSDERDPTFTADGKRVLFLTRRSGGDAIGEADRKDTVSEFSNAFVHGDLPGLQGITISHDGLRLYGDSGARIRMFTRLTLVTPFDAGVDLGPSRRFPSISHDQRELLFEDGGMISRVRRATDKDPFDGVPERLLEGEDPYLADSGLTLVLRTNGTLSIAVRDCVPP